MTVYDTSCHKQVFGLSETQPCYNINEGSWIPGYLKQFNSVNFIITQINAAKIQHLDIMLTVA